MFRKGTSTFTCFSHSNAASMSKVNKGERMEVESVLYCWCLEDSMCCQSTIYTAMEYRSLLSGGLLLRQIILRLTFYPLPC